LLPEQLILFLRLLSALAVVVVLLTQPILAGAAQGLEDFYLLPQYLFR
jgi:hypothetical protein